MYQLLTLPGYGNSGPDHWQSLWEQENPQIQRLALGDWDAPHLDRWMERLEHAVATAGPRTVLIAHSLACLLVAHWAATSSRRIAGALLVAPPDPTAAAFPKAIQGFAQVPQAPLVFPSILVASENDPYADWAFAKACANNWHSELITIGKAGHINTAAGFGPWPEGQNHLQRLLAQLTPVE